MKKNVLDMIYVSFRNCLHEVRYRAIDAKLK